MAVANVALSDTFDVWRTRTNQIAVQSNSFESSIIDLYGRSNNSPSYTYANNIGVQANSFASATIAGANTAVGNGANTYANVNITAANTFLISVIAGANTAVGNGANNFMRATLLGANAAVGLGANSYANTVGINAGAGANAYANLVWSRSNTYASFANNLTSGIVPFARLDGLYTGIKGVGTLTSGTWTATIVGTLYGGTGSSFNASAGAVTYSTSTGLTLTAVGSAGQLLQSGATGAPSWISPSGLTVGTATNSNALSGYTLQFGNVVGVAGRDGAGDITGRLFRAEYPFEGYMNGGLAFRVASGAGTDNYTRYCSSPAAVRGWLTAGDELIAAIAMNTGATSIGFGADLNPYRKIWVSAVGVSHNGAGTTARTFRIYSPSTGGSQTCSQSYTGAGSWSGFVLIDMYSGIGIYCDDGTTVNANPFAIYKSSGGFSFNTSGTNGFDGGTIYVWGERG